MLMVLAAPSWSATQGKVVWAHLISCPIIGRSCDGGKGGWEGGKVGRGEGGVRRMCLLIKSDDGVIEDLCLRTPRAP